MRINRYTTYICGASLLFASLTGCGARTYTPSETAALNQASAQIILDSASYACRDNREYLVYERGPYISITATGRVC